MITMTNSLVIGVNEFTEHSVSAFFDCKIPEEETEFWPDTNSYFDFSNACNDCIEHLIEAESWGTEHKIYAKTYWINEQKELLTITREVYRFDLFTNYNEFANFLYSLYEKYAILSDEAIFYIIVHTKVVATNLLSKYLIQRTNNLKYQKETTNFLMDKFTKYLSMPF